MQNKSIGREENFNTVGRLPQCGQRKTSDRIASWLQPHAILAATALRFYFKCISSCPATHLAYGRCYKCNIINNLNLKEYESKGS